MASEHPIRDNGICQAFSAMRVWLMQITIRKTSENIPRFVGDPRSRYDTSVNLYYGRRDTSASFHVRTHMHTAKLQDGFRGS